MKCCICAGLIVCGLSTVAHAQVKQARVESRIAQVTLYRSQALIARDVSVPDDTGELAVELDELPPSIVPGSIFASSKEVKVRSVRFLTTQVSVEPPKDKVALFEKRLKELEVAKEKLKPRRVLLTKKEGFLQQIEAQYVAKLGPATTALTANDVGVSGFDFKTIAEMTEFVFKQREAIAALALALDDEERALNEEQKGELTKLNALREESGLATRRKGEGAERNVIRKAIVYIAKEHPGPAALRVYYLVNDASWNPAYNTRVSGGGKELHLEYLAHVHQTTGEDWNGVTLTLSTATPSMNAEVPILAPMWINLVSSVAADRVDRSKGQGDNELAQAWQAQTENASTFMKSGKRGDIQQNLALNQGASSLQIVEFHNRKDDIKRWNEGVRQIEQQMAVEYAIPDTVTLASRNDNQMVQILAQAIESTLYYEAVPLLAGFVSRGVEALNTLERPLLAGEYSAFVDGQYVGKGSLPMTATGQFIMLGFGIDPQLRCRRELIDKTGSKSWGDRTETYKYRLTIDNYKPNSVTIRLLDRIPVTTDKGLKITLTQGSAQLSQEPEYKELDFPKGILRWDVALPGSSSGSRATKLDYAYDMVFDSDMQISTQGEAIQERVREDLKELEMRRSRK